MILAISYRFVRCLTFLFPFCPQESFCRADVFSFYPRMARMVYLNPLVNETLLFLLCLDWSEVALSVCFFPNCPAFAGCPQNGLPLRSAKGWSFDHGTTFLSFLSAEFLPFIFVGYPYVARLAPLLPRAQPKQTATHFPPYFITMGTTFFRQVFFLLYQRLHPRFRGQVFLQYPLFAVLSLCPPSPLFFCFFLRRSARSFSSARFYRQKLSLYGDDAFPLLDCGVSWSVPFISLLLCN